MVVRLVPYVETPILLPLFRVSQNSPAVQSESLTQAPPIGFSVLAGAHIPPFAPSEFWQLPEQQSLSSVQPAASGAHALHRPPLHTPEFEAEPGTRQQSRLDLHAVALLTDMHEEHTPLAHSEQSDGHCDEFVQVWPHESSFTHTFTLEFWMLGLHMPERQLASVAQLSMGLETRQVPVLVDEESYLHV